MSKIKLYIGGTFDCIHSGHINLFKKAHKLGKVIVAVNSDEFATKYKRKPLIPLKDRIAVISQLRCVDRVVINRGDSKVTIKQTRPDYIVHGDDWTGDSLMTQMGLTPEFMSKYNVKFKYFPYTKGISTSKIRNL